MEELIKEIEELDKIIAITGDEEPPDFASLVTIISLKVRRAALAEQLNELKKDDPKPAVKPKDLEERVKELENFRDTVFFALNCSTSVQEVGRIVNEKRKNKC